MFGTHQDQSYFEPIPYRLVQTPPETNPTDNRPFAQPYQLCPMLMDLDSIKVKGTLYWTGTLIYSIWIRSDMEKTNT